MIRTSVVIVMLTANLGPALAQNGLMLCVRDNGSSRLELAWAECACCRAAAATERPDAHDRSNARSRPTAPSSPVLGHSCHDCEDYPVASDRISARTERLQSGETHGPTSDSAPSAIPHLSAGLAASSSFDGRCCLPETARSAPSLAPLSTVMLRC